MAAPAGFSRWLAAGSLTLIPLSRRQFFAGDHSRRWFRLVARLAVNGPQLTRDVAERLRHPRWLLRARCPGAPRHLAEVEGEKEEDPGQDEPDPAQFPYE